MRQQSCHPGNPPLHFLKAVCFGHTRAWNDCPNRGSQKSFSPQIIAGDGPSNGRERQRRRRIIQERPPRRHKRLDRSDALA
jgi:hypothetical protein